MKSHRLKLIAAVALLPILAVCGSDQEAKNME